MEIVALGSEIQVLNLDSILCTHVLRTSSDGQSVGWCFGKCPSWVLYTLSSVPCMGVNTLNNLR
jgi:hypothetical protein